MTTVFPPATIHYQDPLLSNSTTTTPTNKHGAIGTPPEPQQQQGDSMVVALRWLTAIQEATQCLRDRPLEEPRHSVQTVAHALKYLIELETILLPLEPQWDQGPSVHPPKFVPWQPKSGRPSRKKRNAAASKGASPTSVVDHDDAEDDQWKTVALPKKENTNRYALFEESEEDGDDDVHSLKGNDDAEVIGGKTILSSSTRSTGSSSLDDLHEAGDVPTLNRIAHFPTGTVMGMRRLMIRLVTAQSELYAYQASGYRRCQLWSLGATEFHASLCKIHQGLMLADSEISRCLALDANLLGKRHPLMEDAAIVEVAVKSLTRERDSFVRMAVTAKHRLVRKLEAMYIGSYVARDKRANNKNGHNKSFRSGEQKSNGNRNHHNNNNMSNGQHPKSSDRRRTRDGKEDELVEIQMALDNLCQWDTYTLLASADHLKLRLNPTKAKAGATNPPRNNQKRPMDISDRVELTLYPDPSMYEWKFTGSYVEKDGARIEFFEKHNILLDWHYASGELELSWKSRKGTASFFRSEGPVHANFYLEIIQSREPWNVVKHA